MNLVFILVLSKIYVALAHILTRWGEWSRLSARLKTSSALLPEAEHTSLQITGSSSLNEAQMACENHPQL